MSLAVLESLSKPRVAALLEHLGRIDDPREPWRVAHPLREVLFLVVCGTICDCDDYEEIADWGEANLVFLRQHLPYYHGVPGARWLTLLMNRIPPGLFAAAFTDWVRASWPDRPDLVAIDGKTSGLSGISCGSGMIGNGGDSPCLHARPRRYRPSCWISFSMAPRRRRPLTRTDYSTS
jgi:hypothetical protein